ncbi:MAG: VOC family protein [bacterium]|nr:VOC family protein [bacterium]
MSQPNARIHHTHLFASDLDASLDFYRQWFGAEVLADETVAGARNVMVRIGDGRLNFYDQLPRGNGKNGIHHIGIQTDDLLELVSLMKEGGVHFRTPIRGEPGTCYIMVEAPDGVLLELLEFDTSRLSGGAAEWFRWDN